MYAEEAKETLARPGEKGRRNRRTREGAKEERSEKEPTRVENVPEAGAAVRHERTVGAGAGSLADLVTLVDVLGLRVRHPYGRTSLLLRARRALPSLTAAAE